jgi:hypothetical protein
MPTEIYIQIIQSSLLTDTATFASLRLVSSFFNSLSKSNECLAALYCGMYGASVYASLLSNYPSHFTPAVLLAISELRNERIPNGVLYLYAKSSETDEITLEFLQNKCTRIDESEEFMDHFNAYVGATKIEGGLKDKSHLIQSIEMHINKTKFIPAYASKSRATFILEHMPVCLFEESLETALYLCNNSGISREDVNSKMVAKIMWDYGYLKEWSNAAEKKAKVDHIMLIGGFKMQGRAVVDIIRRNTWVSWMQDLEQRVSAADIEVAVKIVIEEQLMRQNGGGYMIAQRLASTYSIPAEFVDMTYEKYATVC